MTLIARVSCAFETKGTTRPDYSHDNQLDYHSKEIRRMTNFICGIVNLGLLGYTSEWSTKAPIL